MQNDTAGHPEAAGYRGDDTATSHGPDRTSPIIGFDELARRLPVYRERTLRALVQRRILPSIRPPGSRKLAFHWPSVIEALKRHQRGGEL